ncbi:MAG: SIS domain-containing protein [Candidatus Babeliales bacterium]
MQTFVNQYLNEVKQISSLIDTNCIEKIIKILKKTREEKGRIFFLGVGGSSGNATHAVNDFRKIVGIESYAPTDNVSELTARVNDDGWDSSFVNWLMGSNLKSSDAIFVLSVGGGNLEKNISANIVNALKYCKTVGAKILGIVGKDGGYTAKVADACLIIPTVNAQTITPHTESFQAVVWHLIVCHPELKKNEMKWESTK